MRPFSITLDSENPKSEPIYFIIGESSVRVNFIEPSGASPYFTFILKQVNDRQSVEFTIPDEISISEYGFCQLLLSKHVAKIKVDLEIF